MKTLTVSSSPFGLSVTDDNASDHNKAKFPQFDSFAVVGDCIKWQKEGFDFTATLEADEGTKPSDFDCYSPIKVKQWKNDEWIFVGVVISVHKNGIEILEHAASLWGIECNYNKKANKYLSEVAQELESEALDSAKMQVSKMLEALQS